METIIQDKVKPTLPTKTKALWIDNARALALLGVMIVHIAGNVTAVAYNPLNSDNTAWWIANIYDSFFRYCVPLFVMITGSLLLPQKVTPLKEFLKKRLNRILLPFIFWSAVYLAFNLILKLKSGELTMLDKIPWFLSQILNGTWPHLWYVYMLIGLYLFIPIIKPWIQMASDKSILYFLTIWCILLALNQQSFFPLKSELDLRYFSGYLGYIVLGYYISERMKITSLVRKLAVLAFTLGYLITVSGAFLATKAKGAFSHAFYENLTINVALMSIAVFILLRSWNLSINNKIINRWVNVLGEYGFGIYLAHEVVLSVIIHFKIDHNFIHPWVGIPLSALVCLIITTLFVYILDKLPYGKYICR